MAMEVGPDSPSHRDSGQGCPQDPRLTWHRGVLACRELDWDSYYSVAPHKRWQKSQTA